MSVNQSLPDRIQKMTGVQLTAYAGATWDWFQTHVDSEAAAVAGFAAPVVDGQMLGALLAAQAQDGLPAGSRVVSMSFRNSAPVYRGETVRVVGEIVDRAVGADMVTITVRQRVYVDTEAGPRLVIADASTRLQTPLRASVACRI